MGFWSNLQQRYWTGAGATPNSTVESPDSVGPTYNPGDPHGVEVIDDDVEARGGGLAAIIPSPWDGWPANWSSPAWSQSGPQQESLVDAAWAVLDLNASVLSSMPVYRVKNGAVLPPKTWMVNPDPDIYTSWSEFAKQLFWDYQATGEAFVLRMSSGADGWPYTFRVIAPWLYNVEMEGGRRRYSIGKLDVTDDTLHIRYKSSTDGARGVSPLSCAGPRLVAAGVLARYASELAQGGGIPKYVLEVDEVMTFEESEKLKEQWWQTRMNDLGVPWKPAVLSGGVKANPLQLSPQEMALMELQQYTEGRITTILGAHPFLLGLPSGDSVTYSNANELFSFHDRRYLKPTAVHVMSALSGWAVPRGQSVELNRDEYSRPPLKERAEAYEKLITLGVLNAKEARVMERFVDAPEVSGGEDDDLVAAAELTGVTS